MHFHKQALLLLNCVLRVEKKKKTKQKCIWWVWGVISANINFQILLCYSPMLLFSFLRNSFMQFRILLFPFEFCYSFFWFYYAITNFFYSVSNSIIRFRIMLCSFPALLFDCTVLSCSLESYYFLSNSVGYLSNSIMPLSSFRPRPHVYGDFCNRKFFYADTPSVHTCPPYTLGVSGDFCIRSPEWKFLYTLWIRIRVDARIRIFLYTLTSYDSYTLRVDADIFVTA